MPMESIQTVQVTQFSDMMHIKSQQMKARMRPHVEIIPMTGNDFAYDGIGTLEAAEVNGRVIKTTFTDAEFTRRQIPRRRFAVTVPVDKHDIEGMLTDPTGRLAEECIRAMERKFDKVVYDAMFANVLTGENFGTSVTFANDGGLTVDATAGLTYEKLLEIHQNFIDGDVGNDLPAEFIMGITGDEHTDLMGEAELISGDYSRDFVVEDGSIQKATGIQLVKFAANAPTPIIDVSGGTRDGFVLAKHGSQSGVAVGVSYDIEVDVAKRPDYISTHQIQVVMSIGAVRTEGKLVQKVQTTD